MTNAESEALLRSVEELRGEVAAIREDADRLRRSANMLRDRPAAQYDVAKAEAMVESSRQYLFDAVAAMWAKVLARKDVELPLRSRVRRAQNHGAASAAQAVALLYRAAGGSSLYERCPLERCDVNAALGHIALQRGILEDAGRVRLGLKPNGPLF